MHTSPELLERTVYVRKLPASGQTEYGITIHENGCVSVLDQNESESIGNYIKFMAGDLADMRSELYSVEAQSALEILDSGWLSRLALLSGYTGNIYNNFLVVNAMSSNASLTTTITKFRELKSLNEESQTKIFSLLYSDSGNLRDSDLATVIRELSKILNSGGTPVRLAHTPTRCRVVPVARIKLGMGRRLCVASDA